MHHFSIIIKIWRI